MKKYLFLLLAFTPAMVCLSQKPADNQSPYLTKSLTGSISSAEVRTTGGNITVSSTNSADARVEVYIKDNQGRNLEKAELAERLAKYELTIDVSNNKLTAIAKSKDHRMDWKKSLSISFAIYAPSHFSTNLSTSGGNIKLNDLDGSQSFRTSGGNLFLDNISGDIDGATSGGNIIVNHSHDNISLTTSGGNIEAADCNGKLSLSTSGGNVRLSNLKGNVKASTSGGNIKGGNIEGALSAHTSGGNINFDALACSVETSTSGGSITVQVVKTGDYVRLSNSGGSITVQLPKAQGLDLHLTGNKISTGSLSNFSGSVEDDKIDGKMNGGGTPVIVKTSGKVNFSLQ